MKNLALKILRVLATLNATSLFAIAPVFAQELKTPSGSLHVEMTISEAELILGAIATETDHGIVRIEAEISNYGYYMTFSCPDTKKNSCTRTEMRPITIKLIYPPTDVGMYQAHHLNNMMQEQGFGDVKARYNDTCALWVSQTTKMAAGRICGGWGIRMTNNRFERHAEFPMGGTTPCIGNCF